MHVRLTIFALAAVASARAQAVPLHNQQEPGLQLATVSEAHDISYHVLGKHYEISIDERVVSSTRTWSRPTAKKPPLTVEKAVRISEKAVLKYIDDPKKWCVDAVALRSIGTHSKSYYLIRRYPKWSGYIGDGIDITVLMNGVAIEPTVQSEPTP